MNFQLRSIGMPGRRSRSLSAVSGEGEIVYSERMLEMGSARSISPESIIHTSNVSAIFCRKSTEPGWGLHSIPGGRSGDDPSDEFCIAGAGGEGAGSG